MQAYVTQKQVNCAAAAVAIAGPVRNGRGTLTNLDWSIDGDTLARVTKAERCAVLNDLQAQAYALGHIADDNLRSVLPGHFTKTEEARLVVGMGTGFNAALALRTESGRLVPPSECGHVTLPVRSADDLRMVDFIGRETGFTSVEDVLSGRGVAHIYAWLAHEADISDRPQAAEIIARCERGSDPLATKTVQTFVQVMGRVVGDLALTHLPLSLIHISEPTRPY